MNISEASAQKSLTTDYPKLFSPLRRKVKVLHNDRNLNNLLNPAFFCPIQETRMLMHLPTSANFLQLPGDEESGLTCRTYVFQNESHTLGNAWKCIIVRYEDVQFCGYTVPHPAEAKMHFRIQTSETPTLDVLKRGLKDLQKVCDHTIDLFEKEVKEYTKT